MKLNYSSIAILPALLFLGLFSVGFGLNCFAEKIDYEKLKKDIEIKVNAEMAKLKAERAKRVEETDKAITYKPKDNPNFVKFVNYYESKPVGLLEEETVGIGVVEYMNSQTHDSMKVTDANFNKRNDGEYCREGLLKFMQLMYHPESKLTENELTSAWKGNGLCVFANEYDALGDKDWGDPIDEIVTPDSQGKYRIIYTINHPARDEIILRVLMLQDNYIIQLKRPVSIPDRYQFYRESKVNDEFNYSVFVDKIKKNSSLQNALKLTAKELVDEFIP